MPRRFLRTMLVATLLLAFPVATPVTAGATSIDYPVCTADHAQSAPRVDGDRVIWVDERNKDLGGSWNTDIYLYDFVTGQESQLTTTTLEQSWAEISGDWVAYFETDGTFGNSAIKAFNVVTEESVDVWVGHFGWAQRPRIDGDIIVWEYSSAVAPSDFDVLAYDLGSRASFTVADGGGDQRFPAIGGGKVIYTSGGGWWSYDLSSTATTELTSVPGSVSVTCTDADDQHWAFVASPDGSPYYLYVMDLATSVVETLATSVEPYGAGDEHVDIDGDLVTYSAEPPGPYFKSYVYSLASDTDQLVSSYDSDQYQAHVSGGTIVWRDMRNYPESGDNYYDIYTNRYIPGAAPVTTASAVGDGWYNTDVEVSLEVTPTGSTIYYDMNSGGTSLYSGALTFGSVNGVNTLEYWGVNGFGEETPHNNLEVRIDKQMPSTSDDFSKDPYVGSMVSTLSPSDADSGVARTFWRLDGGVWRTGTRVEVVTVGEHTIDYFSIDNAGNREDMTARNVSIQPSAVPDYTPIQGTDRYKTAIEASKRAFPNGLQGADADGYRTAVLATGDNWPDALGAASLAGAVGGPILLTNGTSLPSSVAAEIARLNAERVIIVGGTSAVSAGVAQAVDAVPSVHTVERISGANRYETGRKVAAKAVAVQGADYDGNAFVTTGQNFPDALAASPIAAFKGWPVYLMGSASQDGVTADSMDDDGVSFAYLLGGAAALPDSVKTTIKAHTALTDADIERLDGANRYLTAANVAQVGVAVAGMSWDGVALATGEAFPDALAGGVMQGRLGSVVLLTPTTYLHEAPRQRLVDNASLIDEVRYLGGPAAVSAAVRVSVQQIID